MPFRSKQGLYSLPIITRGELALGTNAALVSSSGNMVQEGLEASLSVRPKEEVLCGPCEMPVAQ